MLVSQFWGQVLYWIDSKKIIPAGYSESYPRIQYEDHKITKVKKSTIGLSRLSFFAYKINMVYYVRETDQNWHSGSVKRYFF